MTRMTLDEYRATLAPAPKRSKYGAIATWRCTNCNAPRTKPAPKPKRGEHKPDVCPACASIEAPLRFDSKAEARRWDNLVLEQRAGIITKLRRQVDYPLYATPPQPRALPLIVGVLRADFAYLRGGELVVEDVKGGDGGAATMTDLARWKFRHFEIQYGRKISIVT